MTNKLKYNTKNIAFFTEPQWNVMFDSKIIKNFDYEIRYKMGQIIEALKKHGAHLTHKDLNVFKFKADIQNCNRFHNHIIHHRTTYVANWEKDKLNNSIYLVNLAPHENFDFQKKIKFGC